MKTFVIAQHHGVFLTLQSMHDCGIKDIVVIVPNGQVEKYNKMYFENQTNPEYKCFNNYGRNINEFIKSKGIDAKVFISDGFDIKNTVVSTLQFINEYEYNKMAACILSGTVVIKDYRDEFKNGVMVGKTFGACISRVYQNDNQLSMYRMLGMPQTDLSLDVNFFVVDMFKITHKNLTVSDGQLLSEFAKNKTLDYLPRRYNGKDDVLIGSAISARQTIAHNLNIQNGVIVNLWNKSIKANSTLKSEEIYGYPFNLYSKYAKQVANLLPASTVKKIVANGDETEKCTSGLYECLDIIDL